MTELNPAMAFARRCGACRASAFPIELGMAYQPIVSISGQRTFAYEALVRGADGSSAATVLSRVDDANLYAFDQACRTEAIDNAARLALAERGALLSINFLPNAVYRPEVCIRATLAAAERAGFPLSNIIFEFTESERMVDIDHVRSIVRAYAEMGFLTAIDDFGAGFSGLNLLADLQPDIIKLDMALIRNIDQDRARRAIVAAMMKATSDLGIRVIAEGIETGSEFSALLDLGVDLMQGYYFAKPAFQMLPDVRWGAPSAVEANAAL
jgi:EAL domain-containing protein (putative c-di-GMP-specific phosphodiesterase class I)